MTTDSDLQLSSGHRHLHAEIGYSAWRTGDHPAAREAYAYALRWNKIPAHFLGWVKACAPAQLVKSLRRLFSKGRG